MLGNRRVGVALDFSPSSKHALEWAAKNVLRNGDNLLLILVHQLKGKDVEHAGLLKDGSPLIPYSQFREAKVVQKYGIKKDIDVFDLLDTINRQQKLVTVAKIYWGDARDKICDAVTELSLDCLVMGSRGLGLIKRVLLGSVSDYVVTHASCPVTVVKLPQESSQ